MNRLFVLLASAPLLLAVVPACSSSSSTPSAASSGGTESDAGTVEDSGSPVDEGSQCTAARKTHLGPIAKVSTGEVKVISTTDGVTTLYVDASAGGATEASKSPRVYLKLPDTRVDIDDNAAFDSSGWDLALKRVDVYTNSGDAGPGKGGAALVPKAFDAVTAADADSAELVPEKFFDEDCVGRKDEASYIITSMSQWYDYTVGAGPSVRPNTTFIVRGADGTSRYKLGFVSYTGKSDGSTDGQSTGRFILKVAPL
jgi:HmuY protein